VLGQQVLAVVHEHGVALTGQGHQLATDHVGLLVDRQIVIAQKSRTAGEFVQRFDPAFAHILGRIDNVNQEQINGRILGIEDSREVLSLQFGGGPTGLDLDLHTRIGLAVLIKKFCQQIGSLTGSHKHTQRGLLCPCTSSQQCACQCQSG